MKNLKQLIASFEQKANQDDYALVSKEDLETAVRFLWDYQSGCTPKSAGKTSLNSDKKSDTENVVLIPVSFEDALRELFG